MPIGAVSSPMLAKANIEKPQSISETKRQAVQKSIAWGPLFICPMNTQTATVIVATIAHIM
jgi:hypothetical protein